MHRHLHASRALVRTDQQNTVPTGGHSEVDEHMGEVLGLALATAQALCLVLSCDRRQSSEHITSGRTPGASYIHHGYGHTRTDSVRAYIEAWEGCRRHGTPHKRQPLHMLQQRDPDQQTKGCRNTHKLNPHQPAAGSPSQTQTTFKLRLRSTASTLGYRCCSTVKPQQANCVVKLKSNSQTEAKHRPHLTSTSSL